MTLPTGHRLAGSNAAAGTAIARGAPWAKCDTFNQPIQQQWSGPLELIYDARCSMNGTATDRGVRRRGVPRRIQLMILLMLLATAIGVPALVWYEATTSRLQAHFLSKLGREIRFKVQPGASTAIRYPGNGPFDRRLGYTELPELLPRLAARSYVITDQARSSPRMTQLVDEGLFAPYREKTRAGLTLLDCAGAPLFRVRYPERFYASFEAVPRLLADTLLYIENRELLEASSPTRNPAVEWDRFAKAMLDQGLHKVDPDHDVSGGSTLATQIEKYRHSPEGRTTAGTEKLRQMVSASLRAYLGGEDTTAARRQLVVDYLNTVPLAGKPGYGEVIGIGDGLWAWYGREFGAVNALLRDESSVSDDRALAYRQALSLLIAQRRPSGYLLDSHHDQLESLTNSYLRLLAGAGVIPAALRDAALAQRVHPRSNEISTATISFVGRKAANAARTHLASLLGIPRLYDLDRLDLDAASTLDAQLQQAVTSALRELSDASAAKAAGLMEKRLLAGSDPSKVIYSFTLYERAAGANLVRVQTDNYDQPFDINEGTKLDLGSTAKLRVLVSYLEIIAGLHARLSALPPGELEKEMTAKQDAIGRWAVDYLRNAEDRRLRPMLEAALERKYSASPDERFYTGGALLSFENFDRADNARILTVREALQRSVNLVFIRLMRDIVRHTVFNMPGSSATLLDDQSDPRRREYLARFADREGRAFIIRFYGKYQGLTPADAEARLLQSVRLTPRRLGPIFRTLEPNGNFEQFRDFLQRSLPDANIAHASVSGLYEDYATERFDLADRGYLAGVHPLELWLVGFLRQHPGSTLSEVIDASAEERQNVYRWLFKTRHKNRQDNRIRTLIEVEAFLEIHKMWKRLGYPFDSLVPSYATALGSSADRPAALAELMGILVNDGVLLPALRLDRLAFAVATPYETRLAFSPPDGERVLPAEVAQVARAALARVVEGGSAQRLRGVFTRQNGTPLTIGGKTGTGDHRFESYGKRGVLISSRVVSRAGAFVFYVGERHFGVLTAYVKGPDAANFRFTSALPTQVLKVLAPTLLDSVGREAKIETTSAPAALHPDPGPPADPSDPMSASGKVVCPLRVGSSR